MTPLHRRLLVLSVVASFLALAPILPARALEPERARTFVATLADEASTVLQAQMSESERQQRLQKMLRDGFDLAFIGRLALGPTFRSLTPDQQAAYTAAFERFVLATYGRRLDQYNGQRVVVTSAEPEGEQDVRVRSSIQGAGQPTVAIDWRVRERDGNLRIIDVTVEGISMAISQRSEFNAVVQREGIDGLITMLQDRARTAT